MLAALAGAAPLTAQEPVRPDSTPADSLRAPQQLQELEVTVTRNAEPLSRVPAAVSVVEQRGLRRAQLTLGLDESLNNVPGVYVANRYNFSLDQRLSIRGFGSRASFGTRGVKILLDGVPQTLPDGQSQLTNVEFGSLTRIDVLRGASSSMCGNASGGVISLQSEAADPGPFSQYARVEGGSFGLFKWQARTSARRGPASGVLSISRTLWNGFRQQSEADLRLLNGAVDVDVAERTTVGLRFFGANNPQAQNPGALTAAEFAANPDTAAAGNIRRGADKDVQQYQLATTLRHSDDRGNSYDVALFGLTRDLENPLATPPPQGPGPTIGTYVQIDRLVGGARASATRALAASPFAPRISVGADLQYMRDDRRNFRSEAGVPTDSTYVDQREKVLELGPFVQLNWPPIAQLMVSAGARYDRVEFDVTDHFFADGDDDSGERTLDSWNGNLGASWFASEALVPYVNVSTAFETPTTTELANRPDGGGGFNQELGPQRAWNYEIGVRGRVGSKVEYSATGFLTRVSDAIVQFSEVGGRAFFRNAGKTHNDGVELGLSVAPIPQLRLNAAYTYAHYIFADYSFLDGADTVTLDGNRLPGVPEHFARFGLRSEPGYGFAIDVDHTLSSSIFSDDANSPEGLVDDWGAGVTNLRVSWSGESGSAVVRPFAGINNLFDKGYIASVTINGFDRVVNAPRVLEPAPGINVYVGAELGWRVRPSP
ncbi:MAG TPA: TonB-dependent receptor [Gemmatimonadales bacterium]|nr:TonB-dependent receptor [Gemmatimonadales bacterium]